MQKAGAHGAQRLARSQRVVTAVGAQRGRLAGIEVVVQQPDRHAEERAYWPEPVHASDTQRAAARSRLWELFPHLLHRLGEKKRTAIALDIVPHLEQAGHCPQAPSACDHGGLRLELTRGIAHAGKPGVRARAWARHLQWQGPWHRVDAVAQALRQAPPESFRALRVRGRHGARTSLWVVTQVVRLKGSGRQRLVLVHDQDDRGDAPRLLLTEALPGASGRVLEPWRSRWPAAICQAGGQPVTGLEAAQGRQADAVKRHGRLRGGAPSLLQQAPAAGSTTERWACAQGDITSGQRVRTSARDALRSLRKLVEQRLAHGHRCEHILEVFMPA